MARAGGVLRGTGKVRLGLAQCTLSDTTGHRPREAIECLKRALIATGPHDTSIHIKLAQFHNDLEEYPEAAKYHASVISICSSDSQFSPACCRV